MWAAPQGVWGWRSGGEVLLGTVSNQRPADVGLLWLNRVKTLALHFTPGSLGLCSRHGETVSWFMIWSRAQRSPLGHARDRDWKSHPNQRLSHSLTTPYPPRDNCVLLRYRTLKWSWQSGIYKVIGARRMESTTLAVFEFCSTEVPFSRSSCLCFNVFFPLPLPASVHAVRYKIYGLHLKQRNMAGTRKAKPLLIYGVTYGVHRGSSTLH